MNVRKIASSFSTKFKIIWPKLLPYLIIIVVGLIVCAPSIRYGINPGHDVTFHIYRDKSVVNGLADGQLIPQVDPQALEGFGYSWNMFYGPLSAYLTTGLRVVSFNWTNAVNLFVIVSVVLSGIFLYRFIYRVTRNKIPSLFAAIIYMAAPYHLLDIYIRQAQGELLPFVFAPLLFHGLYNIIHRQRGFAYIAIGASGIVLSHNISALIFGIFAILYLALNAKLIFNKTSLSQLLIGGSLAIGLSLFYIAPLIELQHTGMYGAFDSAYMTNAMGANAEMMNKHALTPARLLFNPTTITSRSSSYMPFSLGLITILGIALYIISRKLMPSNTRRFTDQFLGLGTFSLLLTTSLVEWKIMPDIFYTIQFPWRFMMTVVFFLSIVSAISIFYTIKHLVVSRHSKAIALIALATIAVISSAGILEYATYAKPIYANYDYSLADSDTQARQWIDQYTPVQLYPGGHYPDGTSKRQVSAILSTLKAHSQQPEIASGEATLSNVTKDGTKITFDVTRTAAHDIDIELPLIYYPGYKATASNQQGNKIELKTKASRQGFVLVSVPASYSDSRVAVSVRFGLSTATVLGLVVTTSSVVALCALYVVNRSKDTP